MNSRTIRHLSLTWLALMLLLALTCGSAFVALGRWNLAINLGVAIVKALLVVFVFMELKARATTVKVVTIIGIVLLAILGGLSLTDFVPRYAGGPVAAAPH